MHGQRMMSAGLWLEEVSYELRERITDEGGYIDHALDRGDKEAAKEHKRIQRALRRARAALNEAVNVYINQAMRREGVE